MSSQDLTNLPALKSWLGLPAGVSPNDVTLAATITGASRAIYAWLGRPGMLPQSHVDVIDGERKRVFLRHWPVVEIVSVTIDGCATPAAAPSGAGLSFGYLLKPGDPAPPGAPQALDLFGLFPRRERQGLVVAYQAGYAVLQEAQSVPAAPPYAVTASQPYGPWASDLGVAYAATGAPLTAVAANPAASQYTFSAGVYSFSAADAGASVSLSYGYIPQDIAQAALELAADRFRAADRIGLRSKSVGGQETISYDSAPMPASVLAWLQPYRRVAI